MIFFDTPCRMNSYLNVCEEYVPFRLGALRILYHLAIPEGAVAASFFWSA